MLAAILTPGIADGTGGHSGARCTGFDGATRGSALARIGSWAAVGRGLDVAVGDGFAMVALAAGVAVSAGSGRGVTLDRGLAPAAIVAKATVAVTFGPPLGV